MNHFYKYNIIYFGVWSVLIKSVWIGAAGADSAQNENKCQLPENDLHLAARLHPQNETVPLGSWVNNSETVHLECSDDYRIPMNATFTCQDGEWTPALPTCAQYCDDQSLLGLSTFHVCINNGIVVRQCQRIEPNVAVIFRCNIGYEGLDDNLQPMQCTSAGKFNAKRPTCNVQCGVQRPSAQSRLNSGALTEQSELPWQVAVYQKPDNITYKLICGGSIISPSVIITAAHCFWDVATEQKMPLNFFQVAAGKYYRDYDMAKDPTAQIADVAEVVFSSSFQYDKNNFHKDIAILKLKTPFVFNENISAVCLNFRTDGNTYLPNDWIGSVVGYGDTENGALQSVPMRSISYHSCQLRRKNVNLAGDKFCLQNEGEVNVCRGDSGGGFVMQNSVTKRYELVGIISFSPFLNHECAPEGIVTATNINYLDSEMIQRLEQFKREDEALF